MLVLILGLAALAVSSTQSVTTSTHSVQVRDLLAQEAMAEWAFWMLIASLVGSMLTLVGLGFVWRTLHHTRRTADYAGMAIDKQQDVATHQLRAYVGTAGVSYSANFHTMCLAVSVETANFGQTPAQDHVSVLALNYINLPASVFPPLPDLTKSSSTIYPSEKISQVLTLPLSSDRIQEMRLGTGAFVATVRTSYADFVGNVHSDIQRYVIRSSPQSNLWQDTHTAAMTIVTNLGQLQ